MAASKEKAGFSAKQLQIDKANATMVASIAIASFIVAFSLVASRALLSQRSYQSRVIAEKELAVKQLQDNIDAVDELVAAYQGFVGAEENIIGGSKDGTGERDGDNAKIVLDALPSQYDFPALTTSIEKLLGDNNYKIEGISGSDDEVNQQDTGDPNPEPVEMPFSVSVVASHSRLGDLMKVFERSIRPIQVQTLELTTEEDGVHANIEAKTFYQPGKTLTITTKEVQ